MLKWVYRVWKFRTLRERERERCCGDEFLGCCGFVFYGDDFLVEGIFVGMIFWAVVVFFFWDDLWWYVYHCDGGE